MEKGVFEIVDIMDVPEGTWIFRSRFIDRIKNPGTEEAFEKSRVVVQAHNDKEKEFVLTQSPTIQSMSIILRLATTFRSCVIC